MKSQEQRVNDLARELVSAWNDGATYDTLGPRCQVPQPLKALAERLLEAADREAPKWPTDESIDARVGPNRATYLCDMDRDLERVSLKNAFLADPIIKAAIEMRHVVLSAVGPVGPDDARAVQAVIDAVNEAGL